MSQFIDRLNRTWVFEMTVGDLKPLSQVGIQFKGFEVQQDSVAAALFSDPEKLMEVFMILAHVGDEVSPEDFAKGFNTAATERGIKAALQALADFSPTSPQGKAKGQVVGEAWDKVLDEMSSKLSTILASNSPASPASNPTAAP